MESTGETKPADVLVHPKEPQRRSPVNGTQAIATPLRQAQTAATRARSDRRTYTSRQRQGHTGANRAYRPNAAHRDTQTTRDRTPSDRERTAEATRQKTPSQNTNEPPKAADARRDTRQKEDTRHDRTKDARRTG
jgi:hypothetical protein